MASSAPYEREFQRGRRVSDWHRGLGLRFMVPDPDLSRQAMFSITNTLGARRGFRGRTIFILGNELEYNFSVMHQCPPMHLVALANHLEQDVRDELLVYASLQDTTGAIDFNVGSLGPIRYASFYQESMFLRNLYQYVVWTGDLELLQTPVEPAVDCPLVWHEGGRPFWGTVFDHAVRMAEYVIANLFNGMVPAIDWWDGYPVKSMDWRYDARYSGQTGWRSLPTLFHGRNAVAEGSMVFCVALKELSDLAEAAGKPIEASRFREIASQIRGRIADVFLNRETGLFALMIDEDGRQRANTVEDFLAYPQVRALATGISADPALLDRVEAHRMTPVGVQEARRRGPLASEWMLDVWPEKTHLYALEEFRARRPEPALRTLKRQLPVAVHRLNASAPTCRYPERYDPDDFRPKGWIQGGDPELIHCLLEGLVGFRPALRGADVVPSVPSSWGRCEATFFFQGHWHQWLWEDGRSTLTIVH